MGQGASLRNGKADRPAAAGHLFPQGPSPFQPHLAVEMALDTSQIKVRPEVSPASYVLARPEALSLSASWSPTLEGPGWGGCCQGNRKKKRFLHLLYLSCELGEATSARRGAPGAELWEEAAPALLLGSCSGRRGWAEAPPGGIKSVLTHARAQVFSQSFISLAAAAPEPGPGGHLPQTGNSAPTLSSHSPHVPRRSPSQLMSL